MSMNLMEHLQPHVYIPLKIGGIDISITNAVVAIWLSSFFVLYCNLLGLVPYFPGFTPTSNIWVTASLAIVVFLCTHAAGIAKHGIGRYFKNFIPGGMPRGIGGVALTGFLLLVEIISHLARPFSLAVRLFANMTAGHLVIMVFISMIFMISAFITPVSVV